MADGLVLCVYVVILVTYLYEFINRDVDALTDS